jgi:hypothetical protein
MIDPTFELLWRQIAEAYQQVANNAGLEVEFEHDIYRVQVYRNVNSSKEIVVVVSDDVEVKPPTLIAP